MAIRELKTGGAVIEFGTEPAVKRVAARALTGSKRWTGAGVRRIGGVLPVFEVARIALCGEAQELTDRSALVARVAGNSGVRTQQRETILVIFDLLSGLIPAVDGMALRAIGAHLPAVNVRVTIGAILGDVYEDWLDVALNAVHLFVQAAKRVLRFVVIKFGDRTDGAPASSGVAVFARNVQRSVRIASCLLLSSALRPRGGGRMGCRRARSRES